MRNRFLVVCFLALFASALNPPDAEAFKWRNRRQSTNVIDVRRETRAVNAQLSLETGRRYLVAMMMMAEKDASEQPECVTLNQEVEKLKTVRVELEAMGTEPVRRLVCMDEPAGSRINLCAQAFAKDPSATPTAFIDLKGFEAELADNYGPALEQIGRVRAAINAKQSALAKEEHKCGVSLLLIEKKSGEMLETYEELQRALNSLADNAKSK